MQITNITLERDCLLDPCRHNHVRSANNCVHKANVSKAINATSLRKDAGSYANRKVKSGISNAVKSCTPPVLEVIEIPAYNCVRKQWIKPGCMRRRRPCAGSPLHLVHSPCQTTPQRVRIACAAPSSGPVTHDKSVGVVARCRAVYSVRSQTAQSYLCAKSILRSQNPLKNKKHDVSSQPSFGQLCNRIIQCTPAVCKINHESESRGCQASDKTCSYCQYSERTLGELHCAACQSANPDLASSYCQYSERTLGELHCAACQSANPDLASSYCQYSERTLGELHCAACQSANPDLASSYCQYSERTLGELHCAACQSANPDLANSYSQTNDIDRKNMGCDATCTFESSCQTTASSLAKVEKDSSAGNGHSGFTIDSYSQTNDIDRKNMGCDATCTFESSCQTTASSLAKVEKDSSAGNGQSGFTIEKQHSMHSENKWKSENFPHENSQWANTSEKQRPMRRESEWKSEDCPHDNCQCACTSERRCPIHRESEQKSKDCPPDDSQCACTSDTECLMHCKSEQKAESSVSSSDNSKCACTIESECSMRCESGGNLKGCPVPEYEINTAYKYYTHLLFKNLTKIRSKIQKRLQPNTCSCCSWDGTSNQSEQMRRLCHRCSPFQRDPAAINTLHHNVGFSKKFLKVQCTSRHDSGVQRDLSTDKSGIHYEPSRDSSADHRKLSRGKYDAHRALPMDNSSVYCRISRDKSNVQCNLSKDIHGVHRAHPRHNSGIHHDPSEDNSDIHPDFSRDTGAHCDFSKDTSAHRNFSGDKIEYLLHSRVSALSSKDKRAFRDHVESLLRSIYSDQKTSKKSLEITSLSSQNVYRSNRTKSMEPNMQFSEVLGSCSEKWSPDLINLSDSSDSMIRCKYKKKFKFT